MNILIKSVKIIDPNSKHNNKIMDVLIEKGKINKIAKSIKNKDEIEYKIKNLHLSPGWFDLHANFGEPGYEQQETIATGSNAALKGGFTGVMVMPNNNPSIDNKGMIKFIQNATKENIIDSEFYYLKNNDLIYIEPLKYRSFRKSQSQVLLSAITTAAVVINLCLRINE